ncbi:SRPBCC family protein [Henriciella litoralis]|uniref:SRPBCC family protein n=1 Tax=Henriciella litoralis TaxID=568102 RepID=UPI00146A33C6|nr:SRPBCC family protein [Henriciella litoralis]
MTSQPDEDDFAILTEPTTLVIKRWLPGKRERVWDYLADSDLRRKWLASGDMPATPGDTFTLTWRNSELSPDAPAPDGKGGEHSMESEIVTFDPPKTLEFIWGNGTVTFDLEQKGEKTLLTLTHTGIETRSNRVGISTGWHAHLNLLVAEIGGTERGSFWASYDALKTIYEARVP